LTLNLDRFLARTERLDSFRAGLERKLWPKAAIQVISRRGEACLNLRHMDGEVFADGFREREADALSATITVQGIEALARTLDAAGVEWHQRLKHETWGAQTFVLRDPGGNLIAFAE